MKKKIAVIGANGVPASYGGWDQLVEHFTQLENDRYEFVIFCTHKTNTNDGSKYNNAKIRVINLDANGWQSIPYDIISLYYAWKECDAAIMLGTSGALAIPFFKLLGLPVILNIDGAEWKRGKWSLPIKVFLWLSEAVGVKFSSKIVSDNEVLSDYVRNKYKKEPFTIAYGGDHVSQNPPGSLLKSLGLSPKGYAIKVCRIVPENNVELILDAFSETNIPFLLVGNFKSSEFGKSLINRYANAENITLQDPIYDSKLIDELRSNAKFYVHGHSVGGTNPSLVEAMSLGLEILSYDVNYNRATTQNKAHFFKDKDELKHLLESIKTGKHKYTAAETKAIATQLYSWTSIMNGYLNILKIIFKNDK